MTNAQKLGKMENGKIWGKLGNFLKTGKHFEENWEKNSKNCEISGRSWGPPDFSQYILVTNIEQ